MDHLALSIAALLCIGTVQSMMIEGEQMSMDDAIMKAGSKRGMTKMFEIMQDSNTVRVEIDMLYKMDDYTKMREEMTMDEENDEQQGSRKKRKAILPESYYRWTNARVPYEMSYTFSSRDRQTIMSAINDYHKYTCLRFVPATSSDKNKIRFQNGGGCSSYVGMIGGSQPVSLAPGCRYKGVIIHEMGHAIGFQHEQTRSDRDSYVTIQTHNIQSGLAYNFMRYSANQASSYSVPYDYTSVMHYSQYAFSRNGRPTIVARDAKYQTAMGNRDGFSFNDIWLANTIYKCAEKNGCSARQCPTGAFQGQDCKCWCDSGDRSNPVKECDGSSVVTTPEPSVTTETPVTKPMMCEDKKSNCPYWQRRGYCTGTYQKYMMENCQYSCNYCDMTTTPTTTIATPTVENCKDESQYCSYWARNGECTRNPSYMMNYCKLSCDVCQGGSTECRDMNDNCPGWTRYCTNDIYKDYLYDNCKKSCNHCQSNDEIKKPVTTPATALCMDTSSKKYCTKNQGRCSSTLVNIRCRKTCQSCDN